MLTVMADLQLHFEVTALKYDVVHDIGLPVNIFERIFSAQ